MLWWFHHFQDYVKIVLFPIVWIARHLKMINDFIFADWFLLPNPAEQWPRLLPSPVAVLIQSSTPLLESLTSNRTAFPSWPDSLKERRWSKQETSLGSRGKTIGETVFILQTVQQFPFYKMELCSEWQLDACFESHNEFEKWYQNLMVYSEDQWFKHIATRAVKQN